MNTERRRSWVNWTKRSLGAVAVLYLLFLGTMFVIMAQPPQRFGQIMRYFPMPAMMIVPFEPMWNLARGGTLRVGEMPHDSTLPTTNKSCKVRLADYRGKPVVLVFGSYT